MSKRKVVLAVLDGLGEAPASAANAVYMADTPVLDRLYRDHPLCHLNTSGSYVGLPEGQMGNSEVGHLNLGAGRVVYQELELINRAISDGTLESNPVLNSQFRYCIDEQKPLHFIGLVSDGGVHSHIDHLISLVKFAHGSGVEKIFIHVFTDGRDTDPHSGVSYLKTLEDSIRDTPARIASVIGRYYAMDRDHRWERIKLAYDLLIHGKGSQFSNVTEAVEHSYSENITDEFIMPSVISDGGTPLTTISEGDAVMCFNFRTDRCRQITEVLTQNDQTDHDMQKLDLNYLTMTRYDSAFNGIGVVFDNDNIPNTIGEVLSNNGKSQLRIAETEKYPHVTFFFSGGREDQFLNEQRILIPSPKVPTYDLQPEMSAFEVKDKLVSVLKQGETDFICVNFANPDMVGHTGVFDAAVRAVETVDQCMDAVISTGLESGYTFIITSDHGNSDKMMNPDGTPNTAHTTNPVPCFLVSGDELSWDSDTGKLADIAPTILKLMEIQVPEEMDGKILIQG